MWYRMSGVMAAGFHRLAAAPTPEEWSGSFHALLYQVPERQRAYRDWLRNAAVLRGFGILQQGMMISLRDRRDSLTELLERCPDGAQVYFATVTMQTSDAARAAATAWQLPALTVRLRAHENRLRMALRGSGPVSGSDALRTFNDLTNPVLVDVLRSPRLPAELLPVDWPMPSLDAALHEANATYYPAVRAYLETVLSDED